MVNNLKKIVSSALMLVIISVPLCSLFGCRGDEVIEENKYKYDFIEAGFSRHKALGSANKINDLLLGFKSRSNVFSQSDVTLDVYFGGNFDADLETERKTGYNIGQVDIYLRNEASGKSLLVRQTREPFVSEEYRVTVEYYKSMDLFVNLYNHSEKITIPESLFDDEIGQIKLEICGVNLNEQNHEYKVLISGILYYKRLEDQKIMLSQFEGDYRDWRSDKS